jgi:excisionase family DNA binding protein
VGEVKACEAQEESAVAAEEGFGEDSIPEPPGGKKSKPRTRPRSKRERMRTSLQEILDVEGAAAALGVSRRLVLRLLRAGELPGKKVGREWRILRSAIVGWLKEPAGGKEPQWLEKAREAGRIVKVEGPEGPGER